MFVCFLFNFFNWYWTWTLMKKDACWTACVRDCVCVRVCVWRCESPSLQSCSSVCPPLVLHRGISSYRPDWSLHAEDFPKEGTWYKNTHTKKKREKTQPDVCQKQKCRDIEICLISSDFYVQFLHALSVSIVSVTFSCFFFFKDVQRTAITHSETHQQAARMFNCYLLPAVVFNHQKLSSETLQSHTLCERPFLRVHLSTQENKNSA